MITILQYSIIRSNNRQLVEAKYLPDTVNLKFLKIDLPKMQDGLLSSPLWGTIACVPLKTTTESTVYE